MKNLVILGPTRSGKTTLAEMVCRRHGFSRIDIDPMLSTFKRVFPDLGIGSWVEGSQERFAPFIFDWFNRIAAQDYRSTRYVLEGCQLDLGTAFNAIDHENTKIVALGYPGALPEELLAVIRKYDKPHDWSVKASDTRLVWELREYGVKKSRALLEQCAALGVKFIDTGSDREGALRAFMDEIEEFLA